MKDSYQTSEHQFTAAILAMAGGFLDAYTFICRGQVFANAQTGNIVLMGVSLAQRNVIEALAYLCPIIAFAAGIMICEIIRGGKNRFEVLHWRQIIIAIEIAGLAAAAWIPLGTGDFAANIIISFICALQVEAFRKVEGNIYASTMCTGNLRSATEKLYKWKKTGDKEYLNNSKKYYKVIFFFLAGAAAGGITVPFIGAKAVLIAAGGLTGVLLLMKKEHIGSRPVK